MNKYVDIHAKWLADELKKRGHKTFKEIKNKKNPRFDVFVFRNTIEFDKDHSEIILAKRNAQMLAVSC